MDNFKLSDSMEASCDPPPNTHTHTHRFTHNGQQNTSPWLIIYSLNANWTRNVKERHRCLLKTQLDTILKIKNLWLCKPGTNQTAFSMYCFVNITFMYARTPLKLHLSWNAEALSPQLLNNNCM